jgi:hypothetical protein
MGARILTGLELSEDPARTEGVTMSPRMLTVCAAALAIVPLAADAQSAVTFRCQGKDGKKYYGNTVPPQCYGRLVEQLNAQGFVVKRIEPEASEKELEAKEAEKAQKAKLDAAAKEQSRRDCSPPTPAKGTSRTSVIAPSPTTRRPCARSASASRT